MKAVIWTDVAQCLPLPGGQRGYFFLFCCTASRAAGVKSRKVAAASGHKLQFLDFSFHLATKYTFLVWTYWRSVF